MQDIGDAANAAIGRLTKPIRQSALWDCLAWADAEMVALAANSIEAGSLEEPVAGGAGVLRVEDSPVNLVGCIVETAVNGFVTAAVILTQVAG